MSRDLRSLNLLVKLMVLHRHATAEAILMWISDEQVPSLQKVAPRYLKLVISSTFWPFMLISPLMLFVLWVMILLFSVLTSIPYATALSMSLLVRSLKFTIAATNMINVIANHRLHMGLAPMEMDICGDHGVFPA